MSTASVLERYSQGALARQQALCSPVDHGRRLPDLRRDEIIEHDQGCGDPSRYVREGGAVLDLGGGRICYMAARRLGAQGQVIGIDMNDDMLARRHQADARVYGGQGGMSEKGPRITVSASQFSLPSGGDYAGYFIDIEAPGRVSDRPAFDARARTRRPAVAGKQAGHLAAPTTGGCC